MPKALARPYPAAGSQPQQGPDLLAAGVDPVRHGCQALGQRQADLHPLSRLSPAAPAGLLAPCADMAPATARSASSRTRSSLTQPSPHHQRQEQPTGQPGDAHSAAAAPAAPARPPSHAAAAPQQVTPGLTDHSLIGAVLHQSSHPRPMVIEVRNHESPSSDAVKTHHRGEAQQARDLLTRVGAAQATICYPSLAAERPAQPSVRPTSRADTSGVAPAGGTGGRCPASVRQQPLIPASFRAQPAEAAERRVPAPSPAERRQYHAPAVSRQGSTDVKDHPAQGVHPPASPGPHQLAQLLLTRLRDVLTPRDGQANRNVSPPSACSDLRRHDALRARIDATAGNPSPNRCAHPRPRNFR